MPSAPHAKKLLRVLGLFAAAVIAVAGLSACGTDDDGGRQVTVVGNGQVQGTPDTLAVDVAFESTAPDATTAMNQTSQRTQAVIDALVNTAKIDRKDISTTNVSLQPQYGPDSSSITGYRASNSLSVKIRKLDSASQTLALITGTGGNAVRFNSINYAIDDDSNLVRDARARAFDDAKARAEQYAQLSGLDLGKVISISEAAGTNGPPPPPMPRSMAAQPVPLEPGQQTVGFSVTVVWELS